MFIYKIDYWANSQVFATGSRKQAISKEYKTRDKAYNAMMRALKATDTLNDLGVTDLAASGRIEEVNA